MIASVCRIGWIAAHAAAAFVGFAIFGASTAALAASGCSPSWRVFAVRVPDLQDVDARSRSDVWAIGDHAIVHWDGRTLQTTPLPWKNASVFGISASSPSDVWAVGDLEWGKRPHNHEIPISVHWDGRSWRRVPLPKIEARYAALGDVIAVGPADAWAVGSWGGERTWPLLLHWDGSRWQRVNLGRVAPTLGELDLIDARQPDDVWAVGASGDPTQVPTIYSDYVVHWDGHGWRPASSPLAPGTDAIPFGLDVGLTGDVWTVNVVLDFTGVYFARWAGRVRQLIYRATDGGARSYSDAASISPTDVWVVGSSDVNAPQVLHWNGRRWRIQHTPFDGYTHVELNSISADSADDIWAVGNHLIVRYSC